MAQSSWINGIGQELGVNEIMKTLRIEKGKNIPQYHTGIIEWSDGETWWLLNGHFHRENGPAIERADSTKYWYLNNEFLFLLQSKRPFLLIKGSERGNTVRVLTKEGIETWPNVPGLKNFSSIQEVFYTEADSSFDGYIPSHFTGIMRYPNDDKHWFVNGKLHREDGPAIECSNGIKEWFLNYKAISFASDRTLLNINQLLDTIKGEPNVDVETFQNVENDKVIFKSKIVVSSGGYGFDLTIDSQENVFVDGEQIIFPPLAEDTIDELASIIMKRGQETTHKRFEKQARGHFVK